MKTKINFIFNLKSKEVFVFESVDDISDEELVLNIKHQFEEIEK